MGQQLDTGRQRGLAQAPLRRQLCLRAFGLPVILDRGVERGLLDCESAGQDLEEAAPSLGVKRELGFAKLGGAHARRDLPAARL